MILDLGMNKQDVDNWQSKIFHKMPIVLQLLKGVNSLILMPRWIFDPQNWVSTKKDSWFRPKMLRKRSWKMSFPHPFRWATVPMASAGGEMKRFFWSSKLEKKKMPIFHKMATETAEIKNNKIPPQIAFPSFPKLCVEGWNVTYQVLWGEVCFSVWIMKVRNLSHPRRSSHGKSWRCGYGPRRLCHGGGQGWRYQGSRGRAVWMMLDNDLKSRWLRFGLQQVMLCDIYIYIWLSIYVTNIHKPNFKWCGIVSRVPKVFEWWKHDQSCRNTGRIHVESMRRHPVKSEAVRSCSMAKPRTVVECCAKLWLYFLCIYAPNTLEKPTNVFTADKNHPPNYHDDKHIDHYRK